jgi:hypothetical protein
VAFRYALRLPDGSDVGEVERADASVKVGDVIFVGGGRPALVLAVVPIARIEEFVDHPVYAMLAVKPL